jgi:hypothetical protein
MFLLGSSLTDVSFLPLFESDDRCITMYTYIDSFFVCVEEQTIKQIDPPPTSPAGPAAAPPGEPDLARILMF